MSARKRNRRSRAKPRAEAAARTRRILLEAAGVDTVKELRTRKPGNLHAKMLEVNTAKKQRLVRRPTGRAPPFSASRTASRSATTSACRARSSCSALASATFPCPA